MTAPSTWQQLLDGGVVVFDEPEYGLAIYPTTIGMVYIAIRTTTGDLHRVGVSAGNVGGVANFLAAAEARAIAAREVLHEQESAIAAHHLIQRAKGPA